MNLSFGRALHHELHSSAFDLVYTRSFALLPSLLRTGIPTILELHSLPRFWRRTFVRACNRCARVVCLTQPMARELRSWGVDSERIVVEGDAVDLAMFAGAPEKSEARRSFGIQDDIPVIVYAGQLRSMGLSKGMTELLGALEILQSRGRRFLALIAGGPASEIPLLSAEHPTLTSCVRFLGSLSHASIPAVLSTADVLVYPAPKSDHTFYRRDTSPLKLFEYMASIDQSFAQSWHLCVTSSMQRRRRWFHQAICLHWLMASRGYSMILRRLHDGWIEHVIACNIIRGVSV